MLKILNLCLVALMGASVFAAPKGTSTYNPNPASADELRTARKALDKVDQEIKDLDVKINAAKAQAMTARAVPSTNPAAGAPYEAMAKTLELERDSLVARRDQLQINVQYESY